MFRYMYVILIFCVSSELFAVDTTINFYRPFVQSQKYPPVNIKTNKNGTCWYQSKKIKREDAWECTAEGVTFDPCFVRTYGKKLEATCIQTPWSTDGVKIVASTKLDGDMHQPLDISTSLPWAIELNNGVKCIATESDMIFDGLPELYKCSDSKILIDRVQRCDNEWKILSYDDGKISIVPIVTAWF